MLSSYGSHWDKEAIMCIRALQILLLCLPFIAGPIQAQAPGEAPTTVEITRGELDRLLAPIALYPDTVLSHVLIAATYPLEVIQAHRWSRDNSHIEAAAAVRAVENQDWDPSVKALVAFPDLLQRMSDDLEWTQRLGEIFLVDESMVMDAIQDLREKAYAAGSLDSMKHIQVQREERTIIIEPAVERVVYIPYYDTRVVYGNWWWADYPPVYWRHPHNHVFIGGHYWGPRVSLGSTFFFTSFHWPQRRVVTIDYRHNHYPRLYSSRNIARFDHARHWQHNPVHRRGVSYRYNRLQELYHHRNTHTTAQQRRQIRQTDRNSRHTIAPRNQPARPGRAVSDSTSRERHSQERSRAIRQRLETTGPTSEPTRTGRARSHERRAAGDSASNSRRTTRPSQNSQTESAAPTVHFSNRENNDRPGRDFRNSRRDSAATAPESTIRSGAPNRATTGFSRSTNRNDLTSRREQLRDRQTTPRNNQSRPTNTDRANRPSREMSRPTSGGRFESGPRQRFESRPTRER